MNTMPLSMRRATRLPRGMSWVNARGRPASSSSTRRHRSNPGLRAGGEPESGADDRKGDAVQWRQLLAQKDRREQQTECRGEKEVGADAAGLAVLEDPEPEHGGADAEDHDEIHEAPDQRSGPVHLRHSFER